MFQLFFLLLLTILSGRALSMGYIITGHRGWDANFMDFADPCILCYLDKGVGEEVSRHSPKCVSRVRTCDIMAFKTRFILVFYFPYSDLFFPNYMHNAVYITAVTICQLVEIDD